MKSNLTSTEKLKTLTAIGQNIDCELLQSHLNIAQEIYIAPILGDCLYEDLVTNFDANTLSADYQTLLDDYITPAIGFAAWYNAAPFLHMRTSRNGINKSGTDTLSPIELSEFSMYMSKVENMMKFYLKRLEDYLNCNKAKFSLYCQNSSEVNFGGSIFTGWNVHPKRGRYWDQEGGDPDSILGITGNCNGCNDCPDC